MHVNISFTNEWTTWQLTMIPSLLKERNQHYIYICFFSVVIPGFRSIGYSFISGTSVFSDFCPTSILSFFSKTHPSTYCTPTNLHLATGCFSKAFGSPTHLGRSDLGVNTLGTQRVEEFDQGCILPEAKPDSVLDGWDNGWVLLFFLV